MSVLTNVAGFSLKTVSFKKIVNTLLKINATIIKLTARGSGQLQAQDAGSDKLYGLNLVSRVVNSIYINYNAIFEDSTLKNPINKAFLKQIEKKMNRQAIPDLAVDRVDFLLQDDTLQSIFKTKTNVFELQFWNYLFNNKLVKDEVLADSYNYHLVKSCGFKSSILKLKAIYERRERLLRKKPKALAFWTGNTVASLTLPISLCQYLKNLFDNIGMIIMFKKTQRETLDVKEVI